MRVNTIRVRLRKTKQIVECYAQDIDTNNNLYLQVEKNINGEKYYSTERIPPSEYEILPEQDFYDFRNQTAREVLLKLIDIDAGSDNPDNDVDKLIDKAIKITDKLISKL